jgi:hypothetical protein
MSERPIGRRTVRPVLNPDKDMSVAHAFDESRPLPRSALEALGHEIPWGHHPDDDMWLEGEDEQAGE